MNENTALVITSISEPNSVLTTIAQESIRHEADFILIGDEASPPVFNLEGCRFFSLTSQKELPFQLAKICPEKHYCRKNIGYLLAIQSQASIIIETDDDNMPQKSFWANRSRQQTVPVASDTGWLNVYAYFSQQNIWPRGLPLDKIHADRPSLDSLGVRAVSCPIQQGLADGDPDVDAIYRLVLPLPLTFAPDVRVALSEGSWCPFNSQNTAWWPECYPLLYLPAYCSFRMTDIWRSFVAQAIAWANGWSVLFHEATVFQERNEHNLMKDFSQEVPGYLGNTEIADLLQDLPLQPGIENIINNMRLAYTTLIKASFLEDKELVLLEAWFEDLKSLGWPSDVFD
ncbi:MAG: STELLO glycosyltransferase family protein [Nodosilinea sp.]